MERLKTAARAVLLASMSVTLLGAAAIAADTGTAPPEQSDQGAIYLRGDVGWSFLDWDGPDDDAVDVGVGAGVLWNDVLRSDVRLDWSGNYDTTVSDLDATTLTGNTYIDIPLDLTFTPYLGAGAGWGWIDGDHGNDDSGFTWNLMAGATFSLTDSLALDAGYRFRDIMIDGDNFTDHTISAGALFKF